MNAGGDEDVQIAFGFDGGAAEIVRSTPIPAYEMDAT